MSDRLVERLEARIAERIAALEAEREKLAVRETALAVREHEVTAKLAELRQAATAAPVAEPSPGPVTAEAAPAPAAAAVTALEQREAELAARVSALTEREIGLARRVREVSEREKAVQKRAEELALAEADLELRLEEAEAAERERGTVTSVPEPVPAPEPALPAAPAVADPSPGRWNLLVIERLINEHGERFPDRLDEWASYLYFLREYAEPDGSLPVSFDWLIQDTFAELL